MEGSGSMSATTAAIRIFLQRESYPASLRLGTPVSIRFEMSQSVSKCSGLATDQDDRWGNWEIA